MWLEHFQDKWAKPGKNDTINLQTKYWQTRADHQPLACFFSVKVLISNQDQKSKWLPDQKVFITENCRTERLWDQSGYLMFTLGEGLFDADSAVSTQPSHIYSCHFIWGVLFTLWAVSVWLQFTLLYFWCEQVGNPITILS